MINTKLLQDITYYSRIIREKTKENEKHQQITNLYHNKYKKCNNYNKTFISNLNLPFNQYKYVKNENQQKLQSDPCKMQPTELLNPTRKVLINPHFKTKNVHINPNFHSNLPQNKIVHVNPKVIDCNISSQIVQNDSAKTTDDLKENLNCTKHVPNLKIVQKTNYKIVRKSIKSSHKKLNSFNFSKIYKLDHRNDKTRKKKFSFCLKKTPLKLVNNNTRLKNIGGVFYRTSRNKLQKSIQTHEVQNKEIKKSSIKTSKRLTSTRFRFIKQTEIKSPTVQNSKRSINTSFRYVKQSEVKPVRTRRYSIIASKYKLVKKKECSSKSPKLKSIRSKKIIKVTNRFRKNNVPCPIYCRYGQCSSNDKGTCRRLHDPKLVAICKKFLQGACDLKTCTLSHNVTLEKMPTCKFYLDGFCTRTNCPYLHVKLNDKVEICKDFIKGFCKAADNCNKRHVHLCPNFERDGKCIRTKCPYPHTNNNISNKKSTKSNSVETNHSNICELKLETCNNLKDEVEPIFSIDTSNNHLIEDNPVTHRYFLKDETSSSDNTSEIIQKIHIKLDDSCPDFIPFS